MSVMQHYHQMWAIPFENVCEGCTRVEVTFQFEGTVVSKNNSDVGTCDHPLPQLGTTVDWNLEFGGMRSHKFGIGGMMVKFSSIPLPCNQTSYHNSYAYPEILFHDSSHLESARNKFQSLFEQVFQAYVLIK